MLTKKGAPPLIQRVFHALFALRFRSAKAYALHKSIFMKQENVLMSFTYYYGIDILLVCLFLLKNRLSPLPLPRRSTVLKLMAIIQTDQPSLPTVSGTSSSLSRQTRITLHIKNGTCRICPLCPSHSAMK